MPYQPTLAYAQEQDRKDPLRGYREQFYFPQHQGRDTLYFTGNSLGLQPKSAKAALLHELEHWKNHAVEGHFRGEMPWMEYHKFLLPQTAHVVGAKEEEVIVMNTLTANLHLMMVSFYRPDAGRYKIIMEAGAFPSDQYAVESQVRWHGYTPEQAIVEVSPRAGEECLRTEDIIAIIEQHGKETALVLFGGVNYFTGQFFNLKAITEAAHKAGAYAGFDLAHAAGNVPLKLHDWEVDFAVWCSYKYLNSGPGGPSGAFVHERHGNKPELPRFAGWWGHDERERFLMRKGFHPMKGAAGWQLSNAQILSFAVHKASLDIFHQATMAALRTKSEKLTGYLEYLLQEIIQRKGGFHIITPNTPQNRGCQLSIYTHRDGRHLYNYLESHGVISDWREDNLHGGEVQPGQAGVIRVAPAPLYNSFQDVLEFATLLKDYEKNKSS
ncbi:MAG: kynureninase [Phaeodactylibacter sp.]|nr:kynureninase [Phaeodactylibacter sp.]MCB9050921.1 kynureninase [Lewinellaceae bacterium]